MTLSAYITIFYALQNNLPAGGETEVSYAIVRMSSHIILTAFHMIPNVLHAGLWNRSSNTHNPIIFLL